MDLYLANLDHQNTAFHASKFLQWIEEYVLHLV